MNMEGQQPSQETDSNIAIFLRGFFIRLLYGSFAIPVLILIRPGFFGENASALILGLCFYLVVCIGGGAYDVSTKQKRKIKLWEKPRIIDVLAMILAILVIVGLMLSR